MNYYFQVGNAFCNLVLSLQDEAIMHFSKAIIRGQAQNLWESTRKHHYSFTSTGILNIIKLTLSLQVCILSISGLEVCTCSSVT